MCAAFMLLQLLLCGVLQVQSIEERNAVVLSKDKHTHGTAPGEFLKFFKGK